MDSRESLIQEYLSRQRELKAAEARTKAKVSEKEAAKIEFDKTEKYLKNLECIA
jgi:hypothetical protein